VQIDLGVLAVTFAVIAVAELPDKSLVASLILATRSRALLVWLGASAAFVVHVVIAVSVGHALSLLPRQVVDAVAAALFVAGALLMWFGHAFDEAPVEAAAGRAVPREALGVMLRSFAVVFVGEWGDVTQITTANLTARYAAPLSVGLGAALALISVAGLGVTAGRLLLRVAPVVIIRRVAGAVLLVLAALSALAAVR
jgi:putative Ca2+/H+ antiporter (TMEM165/GDT1 family)